MADEYIRKQDVLNLPQSIERNLCGEIVERSINLKDIEALEPADVVPTEPQEIGYDQCANAMLKMWIDNVVTDGEYNRIMDRLNKLYFSGDEKKERRWM